MKVPNRKLKTAEKTGNKLVPLHKQIATGRKPIRKDITGKNK